ncbi:MAG: response regulator [Deltaproteobacteria bacterium]|nr:response regulator [Deltaproteobacteria bacterium]MBW2049719.1 response regulator [Deltaproteobacteria bacterium]MBW2112103.1 response regulator [Deltaproteobacteria bacterium]MBW2354410.1 response regulator [Deltaproteobacteria bacterium]HDZ89484.1 response regulator [Deltaproteobacteria bacterium]
MDPDKILRGKRILIVDDEEDVLDFLTELLEECKIDRASTFEEGKNLLESNYYDAAVLDIMGVKGYELLEIANGRKIPALMLTAHALSRDNLKKSFQKGASYYVPKDEIGRVNLFLADILDAIDKEKNVFARWYERLSGFCDRRFGPDWKDDDPEFWDSLIKY